MVAPSGAEKVFFQIQHPKMALAFVYVLGEVCRHWALTSGLPHLS